MKVRLGGAAGTAPAAASGGTGDCRSDADRSTGKRAKTANFCLDLSREKSHHSCDVFAGGNMKVQHLAPLVTLLLSAACVGVGGVSDPTTEADTFTVDDGSQHAEDPGDSIGDDLLAFECPQYSGGSPWPIGTPCPDDAVCDLGSICCCGACFPLLHCICSGGQLSCMEDPGCIPYPMTDPVTDPVAEGTCCRENGTSLEYIPLHCLAVGSCPAGTSQSLFGTCPVSCSPDDPLGSCRNVLTCVDACAADSGFAVCRSNCLNNLSVDGLADFQELAQCAVTACQATDSPPWDMDCLEVKCTDEMAGCFWGCTFNDCDSLWSCVKGCVSATDSPGLAECRQTCAQEAVTHAQVALLRVFECGLPACHDECDLPGDSACITCLEETAGSSCAAEWTACQP